jgi:hypothetical protein
MRSGIPLVAAIILSVALLECFVPPVARLFPAVRLNLLHLFAIGIGLLLGLIGYHAGEFWDRVAFEAYYGPQGRWQDATGEPLLLFPAGATLKRQRAQATRALARHPDPGEGTYREAAKVARRQAERWERIERPLILSRCLRGLLWPCLIPAALAFGGAVVFSLLGGRPEVSRLMMIAGVSLALWLLCVAPYTHLRVAHMIRLYEDVAGHSPKRKGDRH